MPGFFGHVDTLSRRDIETLARSIQPSTQKPRARDVRLPYPAAWWTNLSNLQKAVRRGDAVQAVDSGERLYRADPTKVRRRLAVIAVEDISFGDLVTTATAMTYAVSAGKVAIEADLECCLGLAEQMASTTKDRILAELVGAAVDSPKRRDSILEIADTGAQECAALYRDEDADLRRRSVAGLALVGALTVDGKRVGARDRNALIAAAMDMDLPDAVVLILECGLTIGGEIAALAVNVPILYGRMRNQVVRVERVPLPETTVIEGLISAAYDQHTRAGLQALSKYRTHWTPLRQFLRKHVRDPRDAIKTLAFRAEGSALNCEVDCDLGDEIYAANERAQADALGMEYAHLSAGKDLIIEGLPVLNGFRREAAAAELRRLGGS